MKVILKCKPNSMNEQEREMFCTEGNMVHLSYDKYSEILSDKEKFKTECHTLKLQIENQKIQLFELQKKYVAVQEFAKYKKKKGINKKFARDCFLLMRSKPNYTYSEVYKYFKDKKMYNLSYETTRVYCKAIRESRIVPIRDKDARLIDMVGELF